MHEDKNPSTSRGTGSAGGGGCGFDGGEGSTASVVLYLAGAFFAVELRLPPVPLRAVDVVFFFVPPLRDDVDGFFAAVRPVEVFFCAICYLETVMRSAGTRR